MFKQLVEFNPETGSKKPYEVYIVSDYSRKFLASFSTAEKAQARADKANAGFAKRGELMA